MLPSAQATSPPGVHQCTISPTIRRTPAVARRRSMYLDRPSARRPPPPRGPPAGAPPPSLSPPPPPPPPLVVLLVLQPPRERRLPAQGRHYPRPADPHRDRRRHLPVDPRRARATGEGGLQPDR